MAFVRLNKRHVMLYVVLTVTKARAVTTPEQSGTNRFSAILSKVT